MKNLHTAGDDHKIRHRWTKASPGPDRGDWLVKVVKSYLNLISPLLTLTKIMMIPPAGH